MARPNKKPHVVVPVRRGSKAYAKFAGRPFYLGRWAADKGRPSAAAPRRLQELKAVWLADPTAGPRPRPGDPMLAELWADWRASEEGAGRLAEQAGRAEGLLFGTAVSPAKYRHRRAAEFTAADLRDVLRALCAAGWRGTR